MVNRVSFGTLYCHSFVPLWSCRADLTVVLICSCLFAELKERIAIMQGTSDLHQLELIYALCGTPVAPEVAGKSSSDNGASPDDPSGFLLNGEVYNLYKELPGWKNNPITTHHAPNIANRFSKFDPDSISLLTQMLHMHPKKRITASAALKHAYFTGRNHPPLPKIEE